MFKKEAWQKAIKWNTRRSAKAKRVLAEVKSDLQYKLNVLVDPKDEIEVECWTYKRLSEEEYNNLRKMCEDEGIEFPTEWKDPFERLYIFKIRIRSDDIS